MVWGVGIIRKAEGREGMYPAPLRMRLIFLFLYRCIFLDLIRFLSFYSFRIL